MCGVLTGCKPGHACWEQHIRLSDIRCTAVKHDRMTMALVKLGCVTTPAVSCLRLHQQLVRTWCRNPAPCSAAINWYRNPSTGVTPYSFDIPQPAAPDAAIPEIVVPVLGVWGTHDAYITLEW